MGIHPVKEASFGMMSEVLPYGDKDDKNYVRFKSAVACTLRLQPDVAALAYTVATIFTLEKALQEAGKIWLIESTSARDEMFLQRLRQKGRGPFLSYQRPTLNYTPKNISWHP